MITFRKPLIAVMAVCIATVGMISQAHSASFPKKNVSVIVPMAAGGGTDTLMRGLAINTEPFLGKNITIVNRPGGSGAIGHAAGLNTRADGHTVTMMIFEILSLAPQKLVPFTYKDFDLLMRVNMDPAAITVPADAPYNTIQEFVAYAKANPGKIKVGNAGPASVWHLAAGVFAEKAGIELTYVPFNGGAPAVTSLVGNHIDAVSVSTAEVQAQVQAGMLKILGVMSNERLTSFPEVATMKESGIDVAFGTWRGLGVPKGTPENAKKVLREAFKQGMDTVAFKKFAADAGLGLAYLNSADWEKELAVDSESVSNTMTKLGLAK